MDDIFADIFKSTNILIFFVFCICFTLVRWYRRCRKPSLPALHCADTELNRYVIDNVSRLTSRYCPPFLLKNRHIQGLVSSINFHKVQFKREYISLDDGGVVSIDWMKTDVEELPDSSPVLMILPGITGAKVAVQFMCKLASIRKYRVVTFNKRGHDNSVLTTPILQPSGDPRDFKQSVEFIHRKYPSAKIAAVGYSAGCALLSRYLGEYSDINILTTSVFIGSGFNLPHLCLTNISRFYERIIVSWLRTYLIQPHKQILGSIVDLKAIDRCSTLREFDYHVYCDMHGYRDVAELWTDTNPMKYVNDINVPVLCINSLDDPICLSSNIPYDLFKRPGWMLVTTESGGHYTFLENWKLESWADKCALDYIQAVLDFNQTSK